MEAKILQVISLDEVVVEVDVVVEVNLLLEPILNVTRAGVGVPALAVVHHVVRRGGSTSR